MAPCIGCGKRTFQCIVWKRLSASRIIPFLLRFAECPGPACARDVYFSGTHNKLRSPCGFVKKYLRSFPIRGLVDAARQRNVGIARNVAPSDHVNPSSDQLWCVFHQSFRP